MRISDWSSDVCSSDLMLGVTYKTAWFMCHRIREAMKADDTDGPLGGNTPSRIVEADETYVGGKAKNRAWGKIPEKKIVVSLVEREGHEIGRASCRERVCQYV